MARLKIADQERNIPPGDNNVLNAVRLGWLTVETFGRLRRYVYSDRPSTSRGDANRRFAFSDRSLNHQDELLLAIDQSRHLAARLKPELRPELPTSPDELDRWLDNRNINALQGDFESWSKRMWVALATEDEMAGQAFTFGGSLADTYWHTEGVGIQALPALLRSQRLEYMAMRFNTIAEYLPAYAAEVLHCTLHKWRIQHRLEKLDKDEKERVLERLAAQAKVWRDLLFGSRQAKSYLTSRDRRLVNWGAAVLTGLVVLAVVVSVWAGVLFLSSAGQRLATAIANVPQQLDAAIAEALLDWQKWSVLLATLSSIVVFIAGFTTRLSGWIGQLHNFVQNWLKAQFIYHRTYRHWGS